MSDAVLIVSAGKGIRVGGTIPKQYCKVANKSVLTRALISLMSNKHIEHIQVVINQNDIKFYQEATEELNDARLLPPCFGGTERADSVKAGLVALKRLCPQNVLIHDAARPFVSSSLIDSILFSLREYEAVLPVIPIFDALWEECDTNFSNVKPGPDRKRIYRAQTPQGFHFSKIFNAYMKSNSRLLDDVAIAYKSGLKITTVKGDETNFKITVPNDFLLAERYVY